LGWSPRKATKASKKEPEDWEDICTKAFFRMAYCIDRYKIPAELVFNMDQTNVVYSQGSDMTYAPINSKQVHVIGKEEKRAFTVCVTSSAAGKLLPFQAIYTGTTDRSTPSDKSESYAECISAGHRFIPSRTKTYWTNQHCMQDFIISIIVVEIALIIATKNLNPQTQRALLLLDVFSVHRSQEFLTWMRQKYPNIIIIFVPGNCT
ncbi:hypothetical protein SISSUDRAFT_965831, partial [Sistotremastrum suecicum HHB10207 ss-3]